MWIVLKAAFFFNCSTIVFTFNIYYIFFLYLNLYLCTMTFSKVIEIIYSLYNFWYITFLFCNENESFLIITNFPRKYFKTFLKVVIQIMNCFFWIFFYFKFYIPELGLYFRFILFFCMKFSSLIIEHDRLLADLKE